MAAKALGGKASPSKDWRLQNGWWRADCGGINRHLESGDGGWGNGLAPYKHMPPPLPPFHLGPVFQRPTLVVLGWRPPPKVLRSWNC